MFFCFSSLTILRRLLLFGWFLPEISLFLFSLSLPILLHKATGTHIIHTYSGNGNSDSISIPCGPWQLVMIIRWRMGDGRKKNRKCFTIYPFSTTLTFVSRLFLFPEKERRRAAQGGNKQYTKYINDKKTTQIHSYSHAIPQII